MRKVTLLDIIHHCREVMPLGFVHCGPGKNQVLRASGPTIPGFVNVEDVHK
ncbi:MAG: hypothetical protein ABSD64_12765 [Terriglobales bacterium]